MHVAMGNLPGWTPRAFWKALSQERVSEAPPAAGKAARPCSPGNAKRVINKSQGTGVPGEVW